MARTEIATMEFLTGVRRLLAEGAVVGRDASFYRRFYDRVEALYEVFIGESEVSP